jgi:hypothetical protein
MDPYLERPRLWPGFHAWLMPALAEDLSVRLLPRYFVALEERVYIAATNDLAGIPNGVVVAAADSPAARPRPAQPATVAGVAERAVSVPAVLVATLPVPNRIREVYLEVRETATGEVVTAIELLSPTNKRPGEGRREYEEKRLRTLGTRTHLVEIDLLRGGEPLPMQIQPAPSDAPSPGDYRVVVARGDRRPWAEVYPFGVRNPLPSFPLPLRSGDAEPLVDLRAALDRVYDRGGYALRIDYRSEPEPPLDPETAAWADALLRTRGLR